MFYDLWKLALAYVVVLVFVCSRYGDPRFAGWAVFFLTLMGLATAIFASAWFHQVKNIDVWVRSQGDGDAPVIFSLSAEAVETTSLTGSTKLKWAAFSELRVTEFDTLLIFPRRDGALTLRTDQVPSDAMDYLKERFQAHGKKIEDRR